MQKNASMLRVRRFTAQHAVVAIVGLCLIVLLVRLLLPRPSIDAIAERYAEEVFSGNPRFALGCVPTYELQKLGMNRDQAERFIERVIAPKLEGVRFVRILERYAQASGMSGVALCELRNRHGHIFALTVFLELSDDGPMRVLKHLLRDAWYIEYCNHYRIKPTETLRRKATLWGLNKDMEVLKSYGFIGFASENDESRPLEPLNAALERVRAMERDPNVGRRVEIDMRSGTVRVRK